MRTVHFCSSEGGRYTLPPDTLPPGYPTHRYPTPPDTLPQIPPVENISFPQLLLRALKIT